MHARSADDFIALQCYSPIGIVEVPTIPARWLMYSFGLSCHFFADPLVRQIHTPLSDVFHIGVATLGRNVLFLFDDGLRGHLLLFDCWLQCHLLCFSVPSRGWGCGTALCGMVTSKTKDSKTCRTNVSIAPFQVLCRVAEDSLRLPKSLLFDVESESGEMASDFYDS